MPQQEQTLDPVQLFQHYQQSMQVVHDLQQQVQGLRTQLQQQADANAPILALRTALETLVASNQEQQNLQRSFQDNVHDVLNRINPRTNTYTSRPPVPLPFTRKFTSSGEPTFAEFRAQLKTMFARFPESLDTDADKINYTIQCMEGAPAQFFAPFVNEEIQDEDGYLETFERFMQILDDLYGDHHYIDEINTRLARLRQTGTMAEYITQFKSLGARARWNDAALLARFKDGLSDEVKILLTSQWHHMTSVSEAQSLASAAYQNFLAQRRLHVKLSRPSNQNQNQSRRPPAPAPSAPTSPSTAMEIDAVRTCRLTPQEKQRRRDNGLCLYCGGENHFADNCPVKRARLAIIIEAENNQA